VSSSKAVVRIVDTGGPGPSSNPQAAPGASGWLRPLRQRARALGILGSRGEPRSKERLRPFARQRGRRSVQTSPLALARHRRRSSPPLALGSRANQVAQISGSIEGRGRDRCQWGLAAVEAVRSARAPAGCVGNRRGAVCVAAGPPRQRTGPLLLCATASATRSTVSPCRRIICLARFRSAARTSPTPPLLLPSPGAS
jgi:hypothetical protein